MPGRGGVGGLGQVEQVGASGVVELQCAGEKIEDAVGDAGEVAPLEAVVESTLIRG